MRKMLLAGLPVAVLLVGLGWGLRGIGGERVVSGREGAGIGNAREGKISRSVSTPGAAVYANTLEREATPAGDEQNSPDPSRLAEQNIQKPGLLAGNSSPVVDTTGGDDAVVWELDPGVRVPAVFIEPDEALSPVVAAAFEQIAQDFEKSVGADGGQGAENAVDVSEEAWSGALEQADAQFRGLFGDANYNEQAMRGTRDALPASSPPASQNQ